MYRDGDSSSARDASSQDPEGGGWSLHRDITQVLKLAHIAEDPWWFMHTLLHCFLNLSSVCLVYFLELLEGVHVRTNAWQDVIHLAQT